MVWCSWRLMVSVFFYFCNMWYGYYWSGCIVVIIVRLLFIVCCIFLLSCYDVCWWYFVFWWLVWFLRWFFWILLSVGLICWFWCRICVWFGLLWISWNVFSFMMIICFMVVFWCCVRCLMYCRLSWVIIVCWCNGCSRCIVLSEFWFGIVSVNWVWFLVNGVNVCVFLWLSRCWKLVGGFSRLFLILVIVVFWCLFWCFVGWLVLYWNNIVWLVVFRICWCCNLLCMCCGYVCSSYYLEFVC